MPNQLLKFDTEGDGFVLVQVWPNGTRSLDVKLVATEGEYPYMAALRQTQINSLRVKNGPCTDSEWQSILEGLVRREVLPDIQATATIQAGISLTITVRKRVGDVTQRLGSFTLNHSPKEEIELLDWCGAAVDAATKANEEAAAANARAAELELVAKDLRTQFDELMEAKERNEVSWLEKFRDLLNEKKAKIREQQKILASVPHPASPARPPLPRPSPSPSPAPEKKGRTPGPSRPAKRKTHATVKKEEEDDDENHPPKPEPEPPEPEPTGNEMDVDGSKSASEDQMTTTDDDDDDDATASEEDDDGGSDFVRPTRPVGGMAASAYASQPRAAAEKTSTGRWRKEPRKPTGADPPATASSPPPPKRALPFGVRKAKAAPPPRSAEGETESDDEL